MHRLLNLDETNDFIVSQNTIYDLRRSVNFSVICKLNIQEALEQVNFTFHRNCSYCNLSPEHHVVTKQTVLIFQGLERSESRATISMSPSSCASLQMPNSNITNFNTQREKDVRSTAQQTDITCRLSHGIVSPGSEEQRVARSQVADSVIFSSPPSSALHPSGRSVSILSSVCALLLAKKGSTGKEVSNLTDSNHSNNICRICFGGESAEQLVRPCSCRGTIAAVHRACLERWLLQASTSYCELCRHHYVVTRIHKWSFLRSLWEWARSGRGRALASDAWRGVALGAASVLGTARALHAADAVLQAGARRGGGAALAANLFSSVLLGVIGALNGLLTTWLLLKMQEHQASWRAWRNSTIHIHVALDDPTPTATPNASSESFTTVICDSQEATVDRSTNIADPFMVSMPYSLPDL